MDRLNCILSNRCKNKHLCCHFCKEKCEEQCVDYNEKCKWLVTEEEIKKKDTVKIENKISTKEKRKRKTKDEIAEEELIKRGLIKK